MARSQSTDFYQNHRFHVRVVEGGPAGDPITFSPGGAGEGVEAGFNSCGIPELTLPTVTYRDGVSKYTIKQQGAPEYSSFTLSRGIAKGDSKFFDWANAAVNGGEYRADLSIGTYLREEESARKDRSLTIARSLACYECIPTRCKPGSDLDSTSNDISMAEVEIEPEWIELILETTE